VETLILGGGIGGLSAALALARRGRTAHVLEEAPEFREIGYGIQLAPNALAVLDQLGVLAAVLRDGFFPRAGVMMSAVRGQQITRIDFGDRFRARYGYPYVVTHRSDLLEALLTGCRESGLVSLENDRQVVRVDSGDALARVECADGSIYEADAVVGADGMRSVARRYTVGEIGPVCSADVAYRGTAPTSEISEDAGLDNVVWWIGPKIHLIHYPIRRGELFNQVAVFSSDRYRAGLTDQEWGTPHELDERFAEMCEYVRRGVLRVSRDRWWTLHDLEPVDNWTRNRVTLLGDAAHAMLQYLAQGAAQALEDSACLGYFMAKHSDDVGQAFAAYQAERLPRTSRVQTWARRMGDIVHAEGTFAIVRDRLLAAEPNADFEYFDWLYGYRCPS
jgi:salicylate hydroxylase